MSVATNYSHIPSKIPSVAAVHFIVMDHDFLRSNDFAGEAFLDLAEVPGIGTAAGSALRQFNLILIHPSKKGLLTWFRKKFPWLPVVCRAHDG